MSNTTSNLDQRLTGLLFGAISLLGAFAIGSATFGDRVEAQVVAHSPAAVTASATVVAMAEAR